jgi:hypothetical protein
MGDGSEFSARILSPRPVTAVLVGSGLLVAIVAGVVLFGPAIALPAAGIALALVLVTYPELCLALFLTAGSYKEWLQAALPLPFDITAVLLGLLGASVALRVTASLVRRTGGIPRTRVSSALGVGLGVLAATTVLSVISTDAPYGQEKAARFIALTVTAALAAHIVLDSELRIRRFLYAMVVLGLLMVVTGRVTSEGMVALNATHIATGRLLGLGLLALLYFATRPGTALKRRLLVLVPGVILGYGFLYSGSRGAFVALLVSLGVAGALAFGMKRARRLVAATVVMLALVVAAVSVLVPQSVDMMNRRLAQVDLDAPSSGVTGTRVSLARDAWQVFTERPWAGTGIGGFGAATGGVETERGLYPHNILLELGAELGLPGVAAFLLLAGLAVRQGLRALRAARDTQRSALAVLTLTLAGYCLVNAMFSGDLNDNRLLFAVLGLCAVPGAGRTTGERQVAFRT